MRISSKVSKHFFEECNSLDLFSVLLQLLNEVWSPVLKFQIKQVVNVSLYQNNFFFKLRARPHIKEKMKTIKETVSPKASIMKISFSWDISNVWSLLFWFLSVTLHIFGSGACFRLIWSNRPNWWNNKILQKVQTFIGCVCLKMSYCLLIAVKCGFPFDIKMLIFFS